MHCDRTGPICAAFADTGLVADDDLTDINVCAEAPTLAMLSDFSAVLVWTNGYLLQPDALGDVLADFVDQGGGVVLATYALSQTYPYFGGPGVSSVGGRIFAAGYSPFAVTAATQFTSGVLDLARSNTNHPILYGVTQTYQPFFSNQNFTNPPLTAGATLIAVDTAGNNVVAVNATGRVVGLSIHPGAPGPIEIERVFGNAVNFVR